MKQKLQKERIILVKLYDRHSKLSIDEIAEKTGVPPDIVAGIMEGFAHADVEVPEGASILDYDNIIDDPQAIMSKEEPPKSRVEPEPKTEKPKTKKKREVKIADGLSVIIPNVIQREIFEFCYARVHGGDCPR